MRVTRNTQVDRQVHHVHRIVRRVPHDDRDIRRFRLCQPVGNTLCYAWASSRRPEGQSEQPDSPSRDVYARLAISQNLQTTKRIGRRMTYPPVHVAIDPVDTKGRIKRPDQLSQFRKLTLHSHRWPHLQEIARVQNEIRLQLAHLRERSSLVAPYLSHLHIRDVKYSHSFRDLRRFDDNLSDPQAPWFNVRRVYPHPNRHHCQSRQDAGVHSVAPSLRATPPDHRATQEENGKDYGVEVVYAPYGKERWANEQQQTQQGVRAEYNAKRYHKGLHPPPLVPI